MRPRLDLRGITKRFPSVVANDGVDFSLAAGEIHALLGENGAGKSTLVKIICGLQQPDSGEIRWDGRPITIADPHAARALGIGVVFQHFVLFETLTVAENIRLGLDPREPEDALATRIRTKAAQYGLAIEPGRRVHTLSMGERQRVEIVRCLLQEPQLLVMDEPTSVLTPQEVEILFDTLRRLAKDGVAILYISHKLAEITALCDRATILRRGRVVAVCDPRTESTRSLAAMMVGGDVSAWEEPRHQADFAASNVAPRLRIAGLTTALANPFGVNLKDVSLSVSPGEILGIAGVAGNGQEELVRAINGETLAPSAGMVAVDGQAVGHLGPRQRRRLGLAVIPEQRLGRGVLADMDLSENTLLTSGATANRWGLLNFGAMVRTAKRIIEAFSVAAPGPRIRAKSLSGGNVQKFLVGRELLPKPKLVVASSPTWGVDVASASAIHRHLVALADRGAAILLISQDLDELFAITDRLAVLFHGRLSVPQPTERLSIEAVGALMGGRPAGGGAEVDHA